MLSEFLHPFERNSDLFRQSPDTEKGTASPSDHADRRGKVGVHIPSIQLFGIAANNAEDAEMDNAIRRLILDIDGYFETV